MRMPNTGIYNAAVIIVRVCILLYFYIKQLKNNQARQRDGLSGLLSEAEEWSIMHSVLWPANASTARWLVSDRIWGGEKKVSRCEVKPHSLLAVWKIFLLRNGAQVVWSVRIPKLKHCGSWLSVVCESDWFAGDKGGPNGTSQMGDRVSVGVQKWFTHVYLLSA